MNDEALYIARETQRLNTGRVALCACGCGQAAPRRKWRPPSKFIAGHQRRGHGSTGASKTPERRAYQNAKHRCENPKAQSWERYGGRGIRFLFTSFEQFITEMGKRPTPAHSLERRNNDGNYEPGNCTWATSAEQHANQTHRNQYTSLYAFETIEFDPPETI
jgi:hypothetical protein